VTDPRFRQRRIDVARQAGRRRLRLALAAAGVVGLGAGALGALHSPVFSVRRVTVTGAAGIPRAIVLEASGLGTRPPLIDVDPAAVERRLLALPEVRTAVVTEHWPSGVAIALTERVPVAAAPVGAAAGVGPWALLDATGRVLAVTTRLPASLPVVLLTTPPRAPGTSVGAAEMPLLAVAAGLPASLRATVTAVAYDYAGDVVLEMRGEPMVVLGDASDLRQKFVSLATVLAKVSTRGTGTIDLTVPASPVLTPTGYSPTVQGIVGG
jgi:cell division protein FtsQ